ncbi:hypothetical protein H6F51_09585 [Cyanobacteria bacterium FACHB-DQ100]|nr:hypothetical protein [Cyanobacteria bacterium FACHB-DQ100]
MKSHMNLAQRTLAILSATGTAAVMALPAFAQAVPTQGVVNNGDVNRLENQNQFNTQTPGSTSDNCVPVAGGVGGPIDSETSSSTGIAPSSYDTARTGVDNGSLTLNSDLSVRNSSVRNSASNSIGGTNNTQNLDSSTAAARIGVPNTAGATTNQSANANMNGDMSMNRSMSSSVNSTSANNTQNLDSSTAAARIGVPNTAGATTNQNMMGSTANQNTMGSTTTYNSNSGVRPVAVNRQFDANNPNPAVAYRYNGPAGTAGHEVISNLNALQYGQRSFSANAGSNQVASSVSVACAPR